MSVYKFVESARSHVGKKFGWRGRDAVLDCVGLIISSFKACGIECPDVDKYDRGNLGKSILEVAKHWDIIRVKDMAEGDIVIMRNQSGSIEHCAIVVSHPFGALGLIHADREFGVVEHIMEMEHKQAIVFIYRYPWRPTKWLDFGGTYYHDEGSDVWLGREIDYFRLEDGNVYQEAVV